MVGLDRRARVRGWTVHPVVDIGVVRIGIVHTGVVHIVAVAAVHLGRNLVQTSCMVRLIEEDIGLVVVVGNYQVLRIVVVESRMAVVLRCRHHRNLCLP